MQSHRKQCKRYDVPGDAHCLTFSCFQRQPLLNRDRTRHWMIEAIDRCREKHPFKLWAYVIMPEHVHMVLLPLEGTRVSALLSAMKQSVAKRALYWLREHAPDYLTQLEDLQPNGKRHYRFWQRGGGYDRNLRSVRDVHEKIRYVHENPVRRGLVNQASRWIWSSARAWSTGEDQPLAIDRESVPSLTVLDDHQDSSLMR